MSTVAYIVLGWTALSIPCGLLFCWLLKRGIIGFAPIEDDPNEFVHDWLERRI